MIAIFQIVLLAALEAAVLAKLEYSVQVVDALPYNNVDENDKSGLLDWELINSGTNVKLKRIEHRSEGVGSFTVDTRWKSETNSGRSSFSRSNSTLSQTSSQCEGQPGIEVTLNKCKRLNAPLCCLPPQDCVQFFCFRKLYIDIVENRHGQAYMRVKTKFYNFKTNKRISIEMNPFKPPTEEADKEHARQNNAPKIDPPIPEKALENSPIFAGIVGAYKNQHFITDIAWVESCLWRAKFMDTETRGNIKKSKTYHYSAGPVIIDNNPHNMILDLLGYDTDGYITRDPADTSGSSSES